MATYTETEEEPLQHQLSNRDKFMEMSKVDLIGMIEYWERLNARAYKRIHKLEHDMVRMRANLNMTLDIQKSSSVNLRDVKEGDLEKLRECMENALKQDGFDG